MGGNTSRLNPANAVIIYAWNEHDQGELQPFALPDTAPEAPAQLYNLKTDPGETTNLYFKHPAWIPTRRGQALAVLCPRDREQCRRR